MFSFYNVRGHVYLFLICELDFTISELSPGRFYHLGPKKGGGNVLNVGRKMHLINGFVKQLKI